MRVELKIYLFLFFGVQVQHMESRFILKHTPNTPNFVPITEHLYVSDLCGVKCETVYISLLLWVTTSSCRL